jgi:hypothetical protein
LNSPPPVLLIILPYIVNIFLKISSSLLSKRSRRQSVEELLSRYKPANVSPLLSPDQLSVLDRSISQSSLYVTTTATLAASVVAVLVITLKNHQPWLWWVFFAVVVLGFIMWLWVYTRENFSNSGLLSFSIGTWVLILFCALDASLAVLSVLVSP